MSDPEIFADRNRAAAAGRSYHQLEPAAKLATEWRHAKSDLDGAQELIAEGGDDAEMRDEVATARRRIEELEEEIRLAMVERDPNDDKNVTARSAAARAETRQALGSRRLRMSAVARARSARELLRPTREPKPFGSRRDGRYSISFEGGTHRGRSVPATESQGRIHTRGDRRRLPRQRRRTCTRSNDLQIDVYRSPGRRTVGQPDRPRCGTHKPSGIVSMQTRRPAQKRSVRCACCGARLYESAGRAAGRAGRRSPPQVAPASAREDPPTNTASGASRTMHQVTATTSTNVLEG